MQIIDILSQAQDGRAIDNLARAAKVDPKALEAAIRAIVPAFAQGFERNTLSRGGLADFVKAIGDGHHEFILDNPQAMADPRVREDGNAILGHVFGTKDRSRSIAVQAAQASGLSEGLIKMLLPYIAQMVMGAIAKWAKGGLGDIIQKLPNGGGGVPSGGGLPSPRSRPGGGGFELPRSEVPAGGYPMPPIPDLESDGSASNGGFGIPWPGSAGPSRPAPESGGRGFELPQADVPRGGYPMPPIPGEMGSERTGDGRWGQPAPQGGQPLPMPGASGPADNPYGDLSDILRRGGSVPGVSGGLGSLVRNILGGLLGFGGRGVIGWLVRFLVMRFGWGLLQRILGRVLTGR